MIRRKLYKTKLCTLFQRGRCPRHSCNFAHGEAELRRFGGSFNGRWNHRSGDLRDKLDRRHSPYRWLSPGSSFSSSPIQRSEKRNRKKQHMSRESDVFESSEASDGPEDRKTEEKPSSYDDKNDLEEQIRQLQLDIEMLDDHKAELEIFLDEKADEAYKLSSQIEELESQINKEQENCGRITSKIKKFIKAHGRYIKAQEELRSKYIQQPLHVEGSDCSPRTYTSESGDETYQFYRSQTRLQKLGYQLSSDTLRTYANEDDPSINVISDGDPNDDGKSKNYDHMSNMLSIKKRSLEFQPQAKNLKLGFYERERSRLEDYKHKQGRIDSSPFASLNKGKSS
ncbi:hypothetical protein OPV22_012065 [Ensete ventricosum]|uniref:C3H1-type domain-containing protein n=1 Tax=Ensete ventricosum TaxID=4639 RepID=A0AAV8PGR2_ENSVE|nr:hypothetical protein OPV22_012065 [Ensete ventricosum]